MKKVYIRKDKCTQEEPYYRKRDNCGREKTKKHNDEKNCIRKNHMNLCDVEEHIIFPLKRCHIEKKYHIYNDCKENIEIKTLGKVLSYGIEKGKYCRIKESHWKYKRILDGKRDTWNGECWKILIFFGKENGRKIEEKEDKKKKEDPLEYIISQKMTYGDKYRMKNEKKEIHSKNW
jgi:hypothetical protein